MQLHNKHNLYTPLVHHSYHASAPAAFGGHLEHVQRVEHGRLCRGLGVSLAHDLSVGILLVGLPHDHIRAEPPGPTDLGGQELAPVVNGIVGPATTAAKDQ